MSRGALVAALALFLGWSHELRAEPPVTIQGGYSVVPLERAVFDPAKVVVETVGLNNWLSKNYGSLDAGTMKGPREYLYYLIDSQVKMIYERDHVVLPAGNDGVLPILFSWSDRLGVYGGRLVYDALKTDKMPEVPDSTSVPAGFDLALRKDMLALSSKSGHWSFAVPYYFMIWGISELEPDGGPKTQVVSLSTGAAKDAGADGHSQATLTLFFGPGADPDTFAPFWAKQLDFSGTEPEEALDVRSLRSRKRYDADQKLRLEYTSWSSPRGQYVVAYLGLDGTYQWNRPHFIDFLRSVEEK